MKAVLISIQPKWCALIANGKKTVEVRKTKPKLETPFKVYIYETMGLYKGSGGCLFNGRGKVIGEFVCRCIEAFKVYADGYIPNWHWCCLDESCVPYDEVVAYVGKNKIGYVWDISDLVIYDKPRELSEFYHYCGDEPKCDGCPYLYVESNESVGVYAQCCSKEEGCKPLARPPQSWCYVEELKGFIK